MPNVSRRSFINLVAGFAASLPAIAGGLVLAPREALAEDDATLASQLAGKESEYVVVGVVAPWQVCFHVVDITNGTTNDAGMAKYPAVKGAQVTVTSRFNNKTATGTTDENGFAYVDIRELAVRGDGEDVNNLASYEFNGSVSISCDSYRLFRTAEVVVTGGEGLQVPAHALDNSDPYAYLVSFDEWDALYWCNDFVVTPKNADEHTINVEVYNLPDAGSATVELWVKGEKSARQSMQTTVGESREVGVRIERVVAGYRDERVLVNWGKEGPVYGTRPTPYYEDRRVTVSGRPATASFKGHFLQEGHADHIPVGASLELVVTQQGHNPWRIPLAVTFSQAVVDEPAGKDGQTLSLINTLKGGSTGVGATWDSGVPIIGGGELKFWAPELPVNVYVNPFGLAQLTLTIPLWGYRNDKGNDEPSGWGRYPRKTVQQQWDKKVSTLKKMSDKTAALISKPGAIQQIDLFKSFSIDINFQALALAQWDAKKGLFQGEVAGQILAALNFTITENFLAGPIPVLITFSLDASLVFGLSAATYATKKDKNEAIIDAICDFSRWSFDYENTGFTMTFNLTPALSVGVGIRGVASISIKGAITLTLFFGVPMGTQPKGLPSPHFSAGWSAMISLVIELFLFTKTFKLFSKPFANFYDNWDGKNLTAQADEALRAATDDISLEKLLNGMMPITDEMLKKTTEATTQGAGLGPQGLTAQATGMSSISFSLEGATCVEVANEGADSTYLLYSWGVPSDESAEAEEQGESDTDDTAVVSEPESEPEPEPEPTDEDAPVAALATEGESVPEDADGAALESESAPEGDVMPQSESAPEGEATLQSEPAPEGEATPQSEVMPLSEGEAPAADDGTIAAAPDAEAAPEGEAPITDDGASAPAAEGASDAVPESDPDPDPDNEPGLVAMAAPEVFWLTPQANADLPTPGVASLGVAGGVRPSSDVRLFGTDDRHVFGATRAKVVSFGTNEASGTDGGTWVFRLASVEVAGNPRTRILATCMEGPRKGESRVVEFDTSASGVSHNDLYDYDFDVVCGHENIKAGWGFTRSFFFLQLAVVSGRRSDPSSPTLADSATDLVFSSVLFMDEFNLKYWSSNAWNPDMYKKFEQAAKKAEQYYGNHTFFGGQMPLSISTPGSKVLDQGSNACHSIVSVQVEQCKTSWLDSILGPFYFATTFLDRSSSTPLGTLKDDATVCLGTYLNVWGLGDDWALSLGPHVILPKEHSIAVRDGTAYEQDLSLYNHEYRQDSPSYDSKTHYKDIFMLLIMLRGANQVHYLSMYLEVETDVWVENHQTNHQVNVYNHAASAGNYDPSIRLVPCPGHDYFLASYPTDASQLAAGATRDYSTWTLHKVTVVNTGQEDYQYNTGIAHQWAAKLKFTPIGPAGFNVVNFAVNPKGTFLFWPQSRDADEDRVWDANGNVVMEKDENGNERVPVRPAVYQIMACRIRKDPSSGKDCFSDPFVVADLPNDTDALAVVGANTSAVVEMLRTVYVDTGERNSDGEPLYHAADVWYTSVPAVRCVTATACEAPYPFVYPGGKITFNVAVRNDGNTYLSGCTLELCMHDDAKDAYVRVPGASAFVTFGRDTIRESTYNRSDGKGGFTNIEEDYALAPGKTSVYSVTVTVPSDWPSGKDKKVLFVASGGKVVTGLYAQAEGDYDPDASAVEFHVEPGEYNVVQARTQPDQPSTQRHMDTIDVEAGDLGGELFLGRTAEETTSAGGSGGKRAGTPNTADPAPSGMLGAGLAAAGAAVLAYERRRADNER